MFMMSRPVNVTRFCLVLVFTICSVTCNTGAPGPQPPQPTVSNGASSTRTTPKASPPSLPPAPPTPTPSPSPSSTTTTTTPNPEPSTTTTTTSQAPATTDATTGPQTPQPMVGSTSAFIETTTTPEVPSTARNPETSAEPTTESPKSTSLEPEVISSSNSPEVTSLSHSQDSTIQSENGQTTTELSLLTSDSTVTTPDQTTTTYENHDDHHFEQPVASASPLFGPIVGGTEVILTMKYGDETPSRVMLQGGFTMEIVDIMPAKLVVVTPLMDDFHLNGDLQIDVFYKGMTFRTPFFFNFRPNPSIFTISPLDVIQPGGLTLTVTGTSLTSVAVPRLQLIVVNSSPHNNHQEGFSSDCDVTNSTTMFCIAPRIGSICNFSAFISMVNETTTPKDCMWTERDDITVYLGIIFDGFIDYQNVSANQDVKDYGRISLVHAPHFPKPHLFIFDGEPIHIDGKNVDTCCLLSEIVVHVGTGLCTELSISNDSIVCLPPLKPPERESGQPKDAPHALVVDVGAYLQYNVGSLEYYEPFPIWVFIVCAVAGFIIIVILMAACVARADDDKAKGKQCCPCCRKKPKEVKIQMVEIKPEPKVVVVPAKPPKPKPEVNQCVQATSADIDASIAALAEENERLAIMAKDKWKAKVKGPDAIEGPSHEYTDEELDLISKDSDSMAGLTEAADLVDTVDVHVDETTLNNKQVTETSSVDKEGSTHSSATASGTSSVKKVVVLKDSKLT